MALDEGISDLIGTIYRGVQDAAIWDRALDGLLHYTGSRFTMVSAVDMKSGQYSSNRFYGADDGRFLDGVLDYNEHMYKADPTLAFAKHYPDAGFVSAQMAISGGATDWSESPYGMWTRDVLGVGQSIACYTRAKDDLVIGVSLHPPAARTVHSDTDIRLFKMLFKHIKQAIHMTARPIDLHNATAAVLVIDKDGTIEAFSGAAERLLAQCDGMRIRDRRLHIEDRAEASRFGLLLRSALGAISSGGVGGGVRVSRPSGQQPWVLKVTPRPHPSSPFGLARHRVTVQIFCSDTSLSDWDDTVAMQLFGLTPTEAVIAAYLQRGLADAAIANHMKVGISTVRSHVKSILAKAEVRSKAELAHLLTMIAH